MDKSKIYGLLMCVAAAVVGWILLSGIVRASYWAIAIPVFLAVAGVCVLVFWIGLTIVTTKAEEPYVEEPAPAATETPSTAQAPTSEAQDQPSEGESETEGEAAPDLG